MPPATSTSASAARPGFVRRHWGATLLFFVVVVPALLFALWTTITLNYTYSRGDRVGYNQKFSRKGWICKTWEGELAITNQPGQAPQIFAYSVRDDAVAARIRQFEGQRVALTYEQHVRVPTSCFGETEYFVVGVRPAAEAPFPGYGAPAAPGVPAVPAAPATAAPAPGAPAAPR